MRPKLTHKNNLALIILQDSHRYRYPPSKDLIPEYEIEVPKRCADVDVPSVVYDIQNYEIPSYWNHLTFNIKGQSHGAFHITVNKSAPPDSPLILGIHVHRSSSIGHISRQFYPEPETDDIPTPSNQPINFHYILRPEPEPGQCMMLIFQLTVPPSFNETTTKAQRRTFDIVTERMDVVVDFENLVEIEGLVIYNDVGEVMVKGLNRGVGSLTVNAANAVKMKSINAALLDVRAGGKISIENLISQHYAFVTTSSRDIKVKNVIADGNVTLTSTAGNIEMVDVSGQINNITMLSATGDITLEAVMPTNHTSRIDMGGLTGLSSVTLWEFQGTFDVRGIPSQSQPILGSRILFEVNKGYEFKGTRGRFTSGEPKWHHVTNIETNGRTWTKFPEV
ncbi:hypothetical protein HDU76_000856 [Blyttiomyces sp. JEL0837]|nr:hypothetical protein HDU76_000856 [Blyttiomyces sp. JEL0837]